jgi:hypothetical protein
MGRLFIGAAALVMFLSGCDKEEQASEDCFASCRKKHFSYAFYSSESACSCGGAILDEQGIHK